METVALPVITQGCRGDPYPCYPYEARHEFLNEERAHFFIESANLASAPAALGGEAPQREGPYPDGLPGGWRELSSSWGSRDSAGSVVGNVYNSICNLFNSKCSEIMRYQNVRPSGSTPGVQYVPLPAG